MSTVEYGVRPPLLARAVHRRRLAGSAPPGDSDATGRGDERIGQLLEPAHERAAAVALCPRLQHAAAVKDRRLARQPFGAGELRGDLIELDGGRLAALATTVEQPSELSLSEPMLAARARHSSRSRSSGTS